MKLHVVGKKVAQSRLVRLARDQSGQEAADYLEGVFLVKQSIRGRFERGLTGLDHLLEGELNVGRVAGKGDLDRGPVELLAVVGVLVVSEPLRLDHHLPVGAAEFAEHAVSNVCDRVVRALQCAPQALDQVGLHRLDMVVQKVRLQIVYTKLKCPETL